jgi:hypothetical protein
MTKITQHLSAIIFAGFLSIALVLPVAAQVPGHNPELDDQCEPGFQWSRLTVACEQAECPASAAGRTYTLECKCADDDVPIWKDGLLLDCVSEGTPMLQASGNLDTIVHFLPEQMAESFRQLAILYRDQIPISPTGWQDTQDNPWLHLFSPGSVNNMFDDDRYACGGYQDLVLDWLEKISKSPDPQTRQLLDGFDFGPIQIAAGAHQAVVIFPSGTDWRLTGIVLDPWKEQRPEIYLLRGVGDQKDWCELFWLGLGCPPEGSVGNIVTPIDANTGRYPTTPNPDGSWRYPGDTGRRPSASSKHSDRKHISVGSPVQVLLSDAYGRRVGLAPGGELVNDFGASVEAHMLITPNGTYETTFSLPDGQYTLELTGTGFGEVHVLTRHGGSIIEQFRPVQVGPGDVLSLDWRERVPVLKDQQGNTVERSIMNDGRDGSLSVLEDVIGSVDELSGLIDASRDYFPMIVGATILALGCLAALMVILVLGFILFGRRKVGPAS